MPDVNLQTPRQLARAMERGLITKEAFRQGMMVLQLQLLVEANEVRRNPVAAYLDQRLAKRAIAKLLRSASESELREVLYALGDLVDFAPAQLLWNADQMDIPLHIFIRPRLEPVFRITYLNVRQMQIDISIEHGSARKSETIREDLRFERSALGELHIRSRHRRE